MTDTGGFGDPIEGEAVGGGSVAIGLASAVDPALGLSVAIGVSFGA